MSHKNQQLVLAIIDFLNKSMQDGTVKQDDKEGLEVAVQCIGEAFGVDTSDQAQVDRLSIKPANLPQLFDLFVKTRERVNAQPSSSKATSPPTALKGPTAEDKAEAEKHKANGNSLMSSKQYDAAIGSYTQALTHDPTNAVYYSNRAAAYSSKGDHERAVSDAEKAIEIDPSFSKAYHRLGHAHYSLGDYTSAADAFKRGLDVDPSNANLKSGLQNAEARSEPTSSSAAADRSVPAATGAPPGMGGLADLLGGMGGGSGAGGMPDMASLLQNPMMMEMAQKMMANGGMDRMMQNPTVANMMNRAQTGGGMPSMAEIMGDPSLRDLASQFMGGAGRGSGAA